MKKGFLFLIFGLLISFPVLAKVEINSSIDFIKKDPKLISIPIYQKISKRAYNHKLANDSRQYQQFKKEIDEEYYNLYQIFEKIIRANKLSYQNWRLAIKKDAENINAYANSANMITIYSSLYDSLFDNEDALAFIISHELAHFLLGHHQTSLENSNKIKELQNQIITLRSFQQIDALAKIEELNTEIDKIYAQERLLELNSDFEAITLMAKAGYNIDCANNALKFLSNLPNVYTKRSSHPQIEERIVNVKEAIKLSNLERLKQEGRENIYNSKVLKVKKSSDKETIVITKSQNNYDFKYIPETKLDKLLKKAYLYYLENDLTLAKSYFEEAFKLNSKNYIPALYLSYICECEYYLNDNEKSLKKAGTWARKANKLNSKDKNTLKQKEEVLETIKKVKEANI